MMVGLELRISGIRSQHAANYATKKFVQYKVLIEKSPKLKEGAFIVPDILPQA